ncbi:Protein translation factor like [Actinidia chinensis var. chinensis]|uniref:Protein translation factor like n=1 Tax=Actinidia chinensis var. chinensis TaxID=1590841 RepID=A0A2R6PRA0_ACTCC|nr:Protein translation factor like [Actinidia chinensis var. chinensis]
MSELDVQIPTTFDPFAEANAEDSGAGTKEYVHVRTQQPNGRKSLTTVQGLKKEFSYNKILKDLKKEFCCNGTVVQDPELGQIGFWVSNLVFNGGVGLKEVKSNKSERGGRERRKNELCKWPRTKLN